MTGDTHAPTEPTMTDDSTAEDRLFQTIAAAAPEPWFYQVHAKQHGVAPRKLLDTMEWLWLDGLLEKAPGTSETGPGVVLSAFGKEVLASPELMQKLRDGEPLKAEDPGCVVRHTLLDESPARVTNSLIVANLAVFAYGAYVAYFVLKRPALVSDYLMGIQLTPAFENLQISLGAANIRLVMVDGQWWRLLSTMFLHSGVLHIAFNMLMLRSSGRFVEKTWGSWRLFVIYFLSGWACSCVGLNANGQYAVGASGAVCGVLATEGMWVLLYRKYLPKAMARRALGQVLVTLLFMAFLSFLPGVGGMGHLGGAIGGAFTALVLHVNRFGPRRLRWPALLLLPLIVAGSYAWFQGVWERSRDGVAARRDDFYEGYGRPAWEGAEKLIVVTKRHLNPLLNQNAGRRDPAKVQAAVDAIEAAAGKTRALQRVVKGKTYPEKFGKPQETCRELLEACDQLGAKAKAYLEQGADAKRADERAVFDLFEKVDEIQDRLRKELGELKE